LNIVSYSAKHLLLNENSTIFDAMKVINSSDDLICLLVDNNGRFKKIITDGDIRRSLLKGNDINSRVINIHNRAPVFIREGDEEEINAQRYLSSRIMILPVLDSKDHVVRISKYNKESEFFDIKSRKVLVLGLGYVGLTLALVMSDIGYNVVGFDKDIELLNQLKSKKSPFFEEGLDNYLYNNIDNGLFLTSTLDAIRADVHIITVGTPIVKETMQPNVEYIVQAAKSIGSILQKNNMVILRSTVPLGTSRDIVLPILEQESGLSAGKDFYLAYCPERTAEGHALKELYRLPQIVGGYDRDSTELASRLFNENTHTVIDVGTLEDAEMCKLLDNTYRDTMFAYSNQMAQLCEKTGLNLNKLIDKVNLGYNRNAIPKPSPGVGGACLSKDPYILMRVFEKAGLTAPLISAAREVNEYAPVSICDNSENILKKVGKTLKNSTVFIIGFAFKGIPETSDLRDSTTIWFLEELQRRGVSNIRGYDPVIDANELSKVDGVSSCTLAEGFQGADAIYIMNNHNSYSNMPILELMNKMNHPAIFYDGWNIFSARDMSNIAGVNCFGIGIG